ncbi:hypothetical protein CPAV1605_757 [seawater metagenome]|uniref:Phospholipid/glycerol acyltransferase domain-containing protein n=1 Tax=seawater metagenome TaxID=1561972 RepID=A0A5E8CLV6_9ZZZZ
MFNIYKFFYKIYVNIYKFFYKIYVNIYKFFYKIYVIFNVIMLYSYLFMTPIFNYFCKDSYEMKIKYFKSYAQTINNSSKRINFYYNCNLINSLEIKNTMNLIIMNHSSICDNFILSRILGENFEWNNIRTVSGYSNRSVQNKTLELHDCLLVDKDIQKDLPKLKKIRNKWLNSKDVIQIILFPEGTIYDDIALASQSEKDKKIVQRLLKYKFKNLLIPKVGIFVSIMDLFKNDLGKIYDVTAIYLVGNKRIYGELEILDNIGNPDFHINIHIKEYSVDQILRDNLWLIKQWKEKDLLMDSLKY